MVLKMETTILMSEEPVSNYTGFGAVVAAELMIGFWFGIGVILVVGIVDGLIHCVEMLMSNKWDSH